MVCLPSTLWGLVDDENGVGFCNNVDGLAAAEGVQLLIDNALVLAGVERLHIDDHDVDGAVRRETVNLRQTVGVIDKEPYLLAVLVGKVLLRGLQRLVDALADGHRRHNDDVLAPAVTLVQLVHGLDVCIRSYRCRSPSQWTGSRRGRSARQRAAGRSAAGQRGDYPVSGGWSLQG